MVRTGGKQRPHCHQDIKIPTPCPGWFSWVLVKILHWSDNEPKWVNDVLMTVKTLQHTHDKNPTTPQLFLPENWNTFWQEFLGKTKISIPGIQPQSCNEPLRSVG